MKRYQKQLATPVLKPEPTQQKEVAPQRIPSSVANHFMNMVRKNRENKD